MGNTPTPKTNGTRMPAQSRTNPVITTDPIVFANHIDWRTMRDAAPTATFGRWMYSPGQRALRAVVCARFDVTVGPDAGDMQYHRGAALTGTRANIDAAIAEYTRAMADILASDRLSWFAAADAETAHDDDTVARLNPAYITTWETYYNAFYIGAVAAYAAFHGVTTVAIPAARNTATANVGTAVYGARLVPDAPSKPRRERKPRAMPTVIDYTPITDATIAPTDAAVDAVTA